MRKGWVYKKLGEVCDITMGQSPDGNSINEANGVEFHQGKTCFGERFLGVSPLYSNAPTKLAEAHSVLLCVRAPVGYPNITDRKICIGRGLCALYAKQEIDNTFLFYSLLGKQAYFEKNATGSTFKAISSKTVSNTTLSIPPKSTQLAIVSELDKINELIRLKKEQLKDFDNLAQSLFYEMFGDPVENEKGWEVKKLGDVCSQITDGTHNSPTNTEKGDFMYVTAKNIKRDGIILDNITYVDAATHQSIYLRCNPEYGDLLYIKDGATTGIATINNLKEEFSLLSSVALLKLGDEIVNYYLKAVLNTQSLYNSIRSNMGGAAITRLTLVKIKAIRIPLPPLFLQQLFAQRIEQIEREKSEVQKSIQDLETLLASRMQYWFE